MEMYNQISKSLSEGQFTIGIFIDLSKAFDTIDHKILLNKLNHIGIRGVALQWIASYLANRKQYVHLNGHSSNKRTITCGVPQGSILGPLLFLIYVNDMPNSSKILKFLLFADDTNIFYSHSNLKKLIEITNIELSKLNIWFRANRLSLNISKTNFIIFGKKGDTFRTNPLPVLIDDSEITQTSNSKFLGVIIDEKLNWSFHITQTCLKLTKNIGILNRLKYTISKTALLMLYNTLILPYLSYCNIIWASTYKTHIDKIVLLQKKAVRAITRSQYLAHTKPLFVQLRLLRVSDICKYQIGMFMFKYKRHLLPLTFNNYFSLNTDIHDHNTKSSAGFHLYIFGKGLYGFSIIHTGPRMWNALPSNITCIESIYIFKKHLKNHLIQIMN